MAERPISPRTIQFTILCSMILVLIGLVTGLNPLSSLARNDQSDRCQGETNGDRTLSRRQLAQLLDIPDGQSRQELQAVLQSPYCQLAALEGTEPVTREDAYPLEFDPQTWLVVQYESDRYTGYRFHFRR
ncbi:MAG TPA: hypothetical protein V6D20_20530 [Candidatus Obscuribacterales bacterium]